jgi:4-hydroxy-3-polyprenylbenzoate decarboxylase
VTQHPETSERNLGLYRVQIIDDSQLALNFSPQSGAGKHFAAAGRCGKALPVCLLMGVDPALIWAAAAPLPDGCDEFGFYQSLFEKKLDWSDASTQPLKVPVESDIVIEGEVLVGQTVVEGPYGNHTGHYVTRKDCPVVTVTAVCCRQQAVVPLTFVGPPPSENIYLGKANEILIREMIKIDFPQVSDVWMAAETIFHGAAVVAVKRQTTAQNKELIYEFWRNGPLSRSRFLLLVDESSHVHSISNSWWHMVNGLKTPRIYSDGGRTAIDATRITPAPLVEEDQQTTALLQQRRDGYHLW